MIDSSEKRNRQLAFELQNSHVCEKRSKRDILNKIHGLLKNYNQLIQILSLRISLRWSIAHVRYIKILT